MMIYKMDNVSKVSTLFEGEKCSLQKSTIALFPLKSPDIFAPWLFYSSSDYFFQVNPNHQFLLNKFLYTLILIDDT